MSYSIMNGRIKKIGNTRFSIVPTTLPHGCITVHSMQDSICCDSDSRNDTNDSNHYAASCASNQYSLKEVHYLRQDDYVVDHCWTSIVVPFYSHTNDQCDDKKTDVVFSVLAVLTRNSSIQNEGKSFINESTAQTQNDDEEFIFRKSGYSKSETRSHNGSVVSLYCKPNSKNDARFFAESKDEFVLTKEIKFHSFPYSLEIQPNVLIVAGASGAEIFSLRRIFLESTSFLQRWSYPGIRPLTWFESKRDSGNLSEHRESAQRKTNSKDESYHLVHNKLHLMVSFPIHAIKICSPFMAAASGGQIGVWNINRIISYLENQIIDHHGTTGDDAQEEEEDLNWKQKDIITAFWSTKVERCQERINCIDFTPTYLALSCWDGTAFVFYPKGGTRTEKYSTNHDENYLTMYAIDKNNGTSSKSMFHQTSSWVQYNPKKSSPFNKFIPSSIAQLNENVVTYDVPEWEIPPLKGDDRQKTENAPTFLSVSGFFNIGLKAYPSQFYLDDLSWITNHFLAISTPGSSIIRCFDLKTGRRCSDLGHSSKFIISNLFVDGGSVNGLISTSSDPFMINKIFWIDNENTIHSRVWPHWYPNEVDRKAFFRKLLHNKEIFVTQLRFVDISLMQSTIQHDFETSLSFYRNENIWKLNLIKPKSTNEDNHTEHATEGLPLPFLTDDDVMDLIMRSNKCAQMFYNKKIKKNTYDSSCLAIAFEGYLGFVIPSTELIYLYHIEAKEWKLLHTDDFSNSNKNTSTSDMDKQPNYRDTYSSSLFNPKSMKIWYLGSDLIAIVFFTPDNHEALLCMQASLWDISHISPVFMGSRKMMFPDKRSSNDYMQELNCNVFDSLQVRLYGNSSTPFLIFFCQYPSGIESNNRNKEFGTLISWNLDWNDCDNLDIKPKKNHLESFLHSEASKR